MTSNTTLPATTAPELALLNAFNTRDFDAWEDALAPEFVAEYPCARGIDRQTARGYNQGFLIAIPDLHFTVERVLKDGDAVAVQWTGTGTHTGPLATPTGEVIPPTGAVATMTGIFFVELRNGKITRECTYWDELELLRQLGHSPAA